MRLLPVSLLAASLALSGCDGTPTGPRETGAPAASEALEGGGALEVMPLDLVAPAEPTPWWPYEFTFEPAERYVALGIGFLGGVLDPVRDEHGAYTRYHWYPNADPSPAWPFHGAYWHELRFAPSLGARVVRVELDVQYAGWNPLEAEYLGTPRPLLFACHASDGAVLGSDALDGSGAFDEVRTVSVSGRGFARCRTSHPPRTLSRIVGMRLVLVPAQEAKVALRCEGDLGPGRVTRGRSVRCEGVKDPAEAPGDLAVTGWSFDGAPRADGDPASPVWEGVMVRGGTVEVQGTIGAGAERSATAAVEVVARDWSDRVPLVTVRRVPAGTFGMDPLPELPDSAHDLGRIGFFAPDAPPEPTGEVRGGPNHLLAYFLDLPFEYEARYTVNDAALARNSAYAMLHPDGNTPGFRLGGKNYCDRASIPRQAEHVERHELKHAEVYVKTVTELFRARSQALEEMTAEEGVDLLAVYDEFTDALNRAGMAQSEAVVDAVNGPFRTIPRDVDGPCQLLNANGGDLR